MSPLSTRYFGHWLMPSATNLCACCLVIFFIFHFMTKNGECNISHPICNLNSDHHPECNGWGSQPHHVYSLPPTLSYFWFHAKNCTCNDCYCMFNSNLVFNFTFHWCHLVDCTAYLFRLLSWAKWYHIISHCMHALAVLQPPHIMFNSMSKNGECNISCRMLNPTFLFHDWWKYIDCCHVKNNRQWWEIFIPFNCFTIVFHYISVFPNKHLPSHHRNDKNSAHRLKFGLLPTSQQFQE